LEVVRLQLQVSNSAREPLYTYNVKVINPSHKRDTKTLTWHVTDVFTSPLQMKERLIESFRDYVPGITEIGKFNLGFFESRNSTGKRWIVSSEDIERMYRKFDPGSGYLYGVMENQMHMYPVVRRGALKTRRNPVLMKLRSPKERKSKVT